MVNVNTTNIKSKKNTITNTTFKIVSDKWNFRTDYFAIVSYSYNIIAL